jgi:N-ethylmaleimide reductase
MSALFTPLRLGAIALKHRVIMAPLTRLRSHQPGDVPHALNTEYYGQRASDGGLIITEATDISADARGYPGAPGIYSPEQAAGWRAVVEAVHAKGGRIVLQLWHTGRISHSSLRDGHIPAAPSAIAAPGMHVDAGGNFVPFETPRALTIEEIQCIVDDFRQAALNASKAGFDGIELHGANGYLIDQFLRDGTNRRTDQYGGPIANRAAFLLQVVEAVAQVWKPSRIGARLSPWGSFNGMADSDNRALFSHVIAELSRRKLAYLHLIEPRTDWNRDDQVIDPSIPDAAASFRRLFDGPLIAASGFTQATAEQALADGRADAVAFGRLFIANPDLPERFRLGAALNPYDRATFYGGDARGYTDYPTLCGRDSEAA